MNDLTCRRNKFIGNSIRTGANIGLSFLCINPNVNLDVNISISYFDFDISISTFDFEYTVRFLGHVV